MDVPLMRFYLWNSPLKKWNELDSKAVSREI